MKNYSITLKSLFTLPLVALVAACGGRTVGGPQDNANDAAATDSTIRDSAIQPDAQDRPDAQVQPDGGGPDDWCYCQGNQVYGFHACIPTLELGCTDPCEPSVTDCGQGYTCETCGASSSCVTEDCRPVCVHTQMAQGPVPDPLRIYPTYGPAGQINVIHIEGWPWYIGALFYAVRLRQDDVTQHTVGGGTCEIILNAPARQPGMYPIWVSQYGGGGPWVLAGMFTYSGGIIPDCIQPGFHCTPNDECCNTPQVPVTCQNGRCLRAP